MTRGDIAPCNTHIDGDCAVRPYHQWIDLDLVNPGAVVEIEAR
jgi:hypothetical protein